MVDNRSAIRRETEFLAQECVQSKNRIFLGVKHGIAIDIEISDMLDTDGTFIGSFDPRGYYVQRTTDCNGPIRKGGQVLRYFRKLSFLYMKIVHVFEKSKMVVPPEVIIRWLIGVMVLNESDFPAELIF
jgi:hypothetical protein